MVNKRVETVNNKCLVLGGGGFVGSAVAERLISEGISLRIFDKTGTQPYRTFQDSENVEWVVGDFQKKSDLLTALDGIETVVHLVSSTLPKSSNDSPINDVQTNVIATLRLLDAMLETGARRIIFASSGGTVYGLPFTIPIKEEHPTEPNVSYGITKLTIEKYLHLYNRLYGIDYLILRIANPYGERQRIETAQGAVAVFLHKAINRIPIDIWGDGSIVRDYLHVTDVAEAFAKALAYRGNKKIFNIGSGFGTSLNELLSLIETSVGYSVERRYMESRVFDLPVSILDSTLAAVELNWSAKVHLSDGLRMTLASIKEALNKPSFRAP